ncbi:MAG TPA: cytochrome c [Saprospiraceae bacterium]|nr:cytochrome c [Saprospiraceae bacterium]
MKVLGFALLGLVVLACMGATIIHVKGVPTYAYAPPPEISNLKVPQGDTALIERGANIASMMCNQCHLGDDGKLSGMKLGDIPPVFGTIASLNITRDTLHGIGSWTDGELYYFLRTGIRKNGSWAPPFMPKYPRIADKDIHAVIAWLRSGDPRLSPSQREYPPNQWNLFVKALTNTLPLFQAPPMPAAAIPLPDMADKVALGRYLADDLYGCYGCHSGDILKTDEKEPSRSFGYYGGGIELTTKEGKPIRTANITMDKETGIGNWTEQEFIAAVKYCKKPGGGSLSYPMIPHAALTDYEASAIFAFLKTVPVIKNPVQRYQAAINN